MRRSVQIEVQRRAPILVVDDDPTLRRALARILRTEGHDVLEAEDGPTAIAMSHEHAPALLVLDDMMPGMDGGMVLDALRDEMGPGTPPAVLLTASGNQTRRAQEMGAVLGLCKPFQVEELLSAVERYRRAQKPEA